MIEGKLAVDGDPLSVRASDTAMTVEDATVESTEDEWTPWTITIVSQQGAEARDFRFAVIGTSIFEVREVAILGSQATVSARRSQLESSARFLP